MASGGKRPGAGRKPGAVNKMTTHAREAAKATGELPHEFLLRVARGEVIDGMPPEFKDRMAAAVAAAPYYAPKLSSVDNTGSAVHRMVGASAIPLQKPDNAWLAEAQRLKAEEDERRLREGKPH